jgi:hypothetical protein
VELLAKNFLDPNDPIVHNLFSQKKLFPNNFFPMIDETFEL